MIFGIYIPVVILYALLAAIKLHWEEGGNGLLNSMHLICNSIPKVGSKQCPITTSHAAQKLPRSLVCWKHGMFGHTYVRTLHG